MTEEGHLSPFLSSGTNAVLQNFEEALASSQLVNNPEAHDQDDAVMQITDGPLFIESHLYHKKVIQDLIRNHARSFAAILCQKDNFVKERETLRTHKELGTFPHTINSRIKQQPLWGTPDEQLALLAHLKSAALDFMISQKENRILKVQQELESMDGKLSSKILEISALTDETFAARPESLTFTADQLEFIQKKVDEMTVTFVHEYKLRQLTHNEIKAKKEAEKQANLAEKESIVQITRKEWDKLQKKTGNPAKRKTQKN
jgi:hypothetical protein